MNADHRVGSNLRPQDRLLRREPEHFREVGDQPVPHERAPADAEPALEVEAPRALDNGELLDRVGDDRAGLGVPDLEPQGPLEIELVYVLRVPLSHGSIFIGIDEQRHDAGAFAD